MEKQIKDIFVVKFVPPALITAMEKLGYLSKISILSILNDFKYGDGNLIKELCQVSLK